MRRNQSFRILEFLFCERLNWFLTELFSYNVFVKIVKILSVFLCGSIFIIMLFIFKFEKMRRKNTFRILEFLFCERTNWFLIERFSYNVFLKIDEDLSVFVRVATYFFNIIFCNFKFQKIRSRHSFRILAFRFCKRSNSFLIGPCSCNVFLKIFQSLSVCVDVFFQHHIFN